MDASTRIPMFSPTKSTGSGLPRPPTTKLPAPKASRLSITAPSLSPTKPAAKSAIALPTPVKALTSPQKTAVPSSALKLPAGKKQTSLLPPPKTALSNRPALTPAKAPLPASRGPAPPSTFGKGTKTKTPAAHPASQPDESRDRLASLASSRPSSRLAVRRPTETINTPRPLSKISRPSLSDRTVESLARVPDTPTSARRRSIFFDSESPAPSPCVSNLKFSGPASLRTKPQSDIVPATPIGRSRRSISITVPSPAVGPVNKPFSRPSSAMSSLSSARAFSRASVRSITPEMSSEAEVVRLKSPLEGVSDIHERFAKTSAALREQIAQVKARGQAKRAMTTPSPTMSTSSDLPLSTVIADEMLVKGADIDKPKVKASFQQRIVSARVDGHLDMSSMGLEQINDDIRTMYDSGSMADSPISACHSAELSSLSLADNEIHQLSDVDFPDSDPAAENQPVRMQFAGLEKLNLHHNQLQSLPVGLRRLVHLTSLDLSHNQLGNAALEIVCQITSLKHLVLAHNRFSGQLPACMSKLVNLKTLDISGNKFLSLPDSLSSIRGLRVLNVSSNQLTSVPTEVIQTPSLIEIDASSNALVGALFSFGVSTLPNLKSLNVANNALASLAFSENVSLPALQVLNVAKNHMISLPDLSGWTNLKSISAADNKISELPTGLTLLKHLRHLDVSNNNLQQLDARISDMTQIEVLLVKGNPMVGSETAPMTNDGRRALTKPPGTQTPTTDRHCSQGSFDDEAIDVRSQTDGDIYSPWKLSRGGTVNLEAKELTDDDADCLRAFLGVNDVRELHLARNSFTQIPFEVSLAQNLRVLDLTDCALTGQFFSDPVHLPHLAELRLAGNDIDDLESLMSYLQAPQLLTLAVSRNALKGALPCLRTRFPALKTVVADRNSLSTVDEGAVKGLQSLDISHNSIDLLPAEIGLLAFEGLKELNVSGNPLSGLSAEARGMETEDLLSHLRDQIEEY